MKKKHVAREIFDKSLTEYYSLRQKNLQKITEGLSPADLIDQRLYWKRAARFQVLEGLLSFFKSSLSSFYYPPGVFLGRIKAFEATSRRIFSKLKGWGVWSKSLTPILRALVYFISGNDGQVWPSSFTEEWMEISHSRFINLALKSLRKN